MNEHYDLAFNVQRNIVPGRPAAISAGFMAGVTAMKAEISRSMVFFQTVGPMVVEIADSLFRRLVLRSTLRYLVLISEAFWF